MAGDRKNNSGALPGRRYKSASVSLWRNREFEKEEEDEKDGEYSKFERAGLQGAFYVKGFRTLDIVCLLHYLWKN